MLTTTGEKLASDLDTFKKDKENVELYDKSGYASIQCSSKAITFMKWEQSEYPDGCPEGKKKATDKIYKFGECYEEGETKGQENYAIYFKVTGGLDPEFAPKPKVNQSVLVSKSENKVVSASGAHVGQTFQTAFVMSSIIAMSLIQV